MSTFLECLLMSSLSATLLALAVGMLGLCRVRPAVLHALWLIVLLKFVTPPLLSFPSPSKLPWPVWPQTEIASSGALTASKIEAAPSVTASSKLARTNKTSSVPPRQPVKPREPEPVDLFHRKQADSMPGGAPVEGRPVPKTLQMRISDWVPPALGMIWLVGSAAWFLLAGARLVRFHRGIREARRADGELQNIADDVADRMRLRIRPLLRITDATVPPMLLALVRPGIVLLPSGLMRGLSPSQRAAIIAHELAHFCRGDHWTRWLEFVVVGLHWWHPAAWFARGQLRKAEECCCDAWVLHVFPDQARDYAHALLATVDFLSETRTPTPAGASGFGHSQSLQRRLEMILKRTVRPELSSAARLAMVVAALIVLPWTPQVFSQTATRSPAADLPKPEASPRGASSSPVDMATTLTIEQRFDRLERMVDSLMQTRPTQTDRDPVERPKTAISRPDAAGAERPCDTTFLANRFKHRVAFETGRMQSKDGGRIEIREVWGTRPKIEVGGQYLVRGKYVLPPGVRGMLYFYASAGGAWGQTASLDLQSTPVDEQQGEFALIHGMAGPGYFHLILTDAKRYSRWFADVYFGTGDTVYRPEPLPTPSSAADPPLQESVRTTLGPKAYRDGDVVEINGVTATSGHLEEGDSVTVRGRVRLQSQPTADLSLYLTQSEGNGIEETDPAQTVRVSAGLHDFVLKTTIKHRGSLHLTLYDPSSGKPIGGTYFGTADQMKKIAKWDLGYYLK